MKYLIRLLYIIMAAYIIYGLYKLKMLFGVLLLIIFSVAFIVYDTNQKYKQ